MVIEANGKRDGKELALRYDNGVFTFNGKRDSRLEEEIQWELSRCHIFAGTYAIDEKSDLNLINVIRNHFFDRNVEVKVSGAKIEGEEFDWVEGRIY